MRSKKAGSCGRRSRRQAWRLGARRRRDRECRIEKVSARDLTGDDRESIEEETAKAALAGTTARRCQLSSSEGQRRCLPWRGSGLVQVQAQVTEGGSCRCARAQAAGAGDASGEQQAWGGPGTLGKHEPLLCWVLGWVGWSRKGAARGSRLLWRGPSHLTDRRSLVLTWPNCTVDWDDRESNMHTLQVKSLSL